MPGEPFSVSAVILASRPRSLRRCLESLVAALPAGGFECLLVLNGRVPECDEVTAEFSGTLRGLRVIRDAPRSLGGARNAAIARASGGWLCFLDDDVTVPPAYFATLEAAAAAHPEAAVIGGPNVTPSGSPLFERCVGHALGSWFCAGPMRRRYAGFARDSWTDDSGLILCNLCVRREALRSADLSFDEDLVRNEENLLLEQLFERGGRALHAPKLSVEHERRSTLASFCRQCYLSGRGRGEMTAKRPSSLRLLHLAPVLGATAFAWLGARAALVYAGLSAVNGLGLAVRRREGPAGAAWLALLSPAAHASYAAGWAAGAAVGLARRLLPRPILAPSPESSANAG